MKLKKHKLLIQICLFITFSFFPVSIWAQSISVAGTVVDSEGPLFGAAVMLKGTTIGVATDINGVYSIEVPSDATLVFSYLSMVTQEIPVNGKNKIDVIMQLDSKILDEMVVVGYGTLEKRELTSSITSLSTKDIVLGVGGATVGNNIKGKVSGLVMSGTDSPNTHNEFQLRGMASVNTSRGPLIVIDGIPGSDIRSVVPEDILSIDILKDASAGAIYGTRATGGVILITTKKAKEGKIKVSFLYETTYKQAFGKPEVLSRREFLRYFPKVLDYGADTDWWDEALSDSPISQRQLITLQGGSENARVYATLMHDDNKGIMMGDTRKDYGGRINANFKALDGWVEMNTYIDYRQANRDGSVPSVNTILALDPTRSPYDANSATGWNIWKDGQDVPNTVGDAALNTRDVLQKWFRPSTELKLNILPVSGLSFQVMGGYENRHNERHEYDSRYSTSELRASRRGTAFLEFSKEEMFNFDTYFSYINSFGIHSLNAVAGYSYYQRDRDYFNVRNSDFPLEKIQIWDISSGTYNAEGLASMGSGKDITQKLAAWFGRIHYNLKDRYIASASLRRESSSKFAANKRWGNFWQLSGAWRISEEFFLENQSWLNELKLRVAYGVTGNEGFSANYAAIMYARDVNWIMPSGNWEPAYGQARNINPDLGWEEKHEWNIGLDYSLFNDRLYGKIDFYRRSIEGLIYNATVSVPPYINTRMFQNIGTLENKGFEFEIGGKIVNRNDWKYETAINLSHNKTTVGRIFGDATYFEAGYIYPENTHRLQEGSRVGSFFLHQHAGFELNQDGETYDFRIKNVDGEPVPAADGIADDKHFVGNYIPTLICGWNHNLSYNNWQLHMTLTSWIDFDIFNAVDFYNGYAPRFHGIGQNNKLRDAFEKNGHIRVNRSLPVSDYFLEDGTFLKLQNINLSYNLRTKQWFNLLDNIRFYLTINNVYTFTKYSGHNPEINITGWENGIEDGIYPQTRSYALGIQLNF